MMAKYIVLEDEHRRPWALVFSPTQVHKAVALRLLPLGTPVSAGFVDFQDGAVTCHGRSESLDLDSRPEDAGIIGRHFFGGR